MSSAAILDAALRDCDSSEVVTLDFGDVGFCDSSGISVLVHHYVRYGAAGGTLRVVNVSEHLRCVFEITGITFMIDDDDLDGNGRDVSHEQSR